VRPRSTGAQRDKVDPGAVSDMKRERVLEARAAAWIDARGMASVTIPPEVIRPPGADPADYADGGDLLVRLLPCVDPGDHRVISVKHDYGSNFTSLDTYATPRIPVGIVGNYSAEDLPLAVFVWNNPGTHFAIVKPEKTYHKWRRFPVKITRSTGHVSDYMGLFCPVGLVSRWVFDETPEDLRQKWFEKAAQPSRYSI
tara:strand:- start:2339 stop:2932 length:594 start_codon:yes stop_codon:yes gene_type:complete